MKLFNRSLALCAVLLSSFAMADVAIIVNPANTNTISDDDIKRIFLGKNKSFASGDKVNATNLASGNGVRSEFEQKALGKSSKQVKAYWSKLIFSGKAKPLVESGSDEDAIAYVAGNPKAIAYVDASKVNDTVKVIKVFK